MLPFIHTNTRESHYTCSWFGKKSLKKHHVNFLEYFYAQYAALHTGQGASRKYFNCNKSYLSDSELTYSTATHRIMIVKFVFDINQTFYVYATKT